MLKPGDPMTPEREAEIRTCFTDAGRWGCCAGCWIVKELLDEIDRLRAAKPEEKE